MVRRDSTDCRSPARGRWAFRDKARLVSGSDHKRVNPELIRNASVETNRTVLPFTGGSCRSGALPGNGVIFQASYVVSESVGCEGGSGVFPTTLYGEVNALEFEPSSVPFPTLRGTMMMEDTAMSPTNAASENTRKGRCRDGIVIVVLVVGAVYIGIFRIPQTVSHQEPLDARVCESNLHHLGSAIEHRKHKTYPVTRSGVRFLLAPLRGRISRLDSDTVFNPYISPEDDLALAAVRDSRNAHADPENLDPTPVERAVANG